MTKSRIALAAIAILIGALAVTLVVRSRQEPVRAIRVTPSTETTSPAGDGFLYGRVTTTDGDTWTGRLRWGGDQEAFWGDFFNGVKVANPWIAHVPSDRRPTTRESFSAFGVELFGRQRPADLTRLFMARLGDIARIEALAGPEWDPGYLGDIRVTLKNGSAFTLDRQNASDFDDGLRVWDSTRGTVLLPPRRIRRVELMPAPQLAGVPARLHGVVVAGEQSFEGFIQWNRSASVTADHLTGERGREPVTGALGSVRSIARNDENFAIALRDGSTILLDSISGDRGIYVDDSRFGRVLVPFAAFDRLEFSDAGSGPSYDDYPAGSTLKGSVITHANERMTGRIVYDLDESQTTETLDAPSRGINYNIPFGLIASIERGTSEDSTTIRLRSGTVLMLEPSGDLGPANGGVLVFSPGSDRAAYVPWNEVARIILDAPPAMYPAVN